MSIALPASDSGRDKAAEIGAVHSKSRFWALTLGSAGVVYGDIGTSPLYAFRAAIMAAAPAGELTRTMVIGVLSLIIWALIIIVTLKYVVVLLRADNRGEGGTLALMALAQSAAGKGAGTVVLLGIISAALFYGDAAITPALSVLSAIEGLKVVDATLENYVVPLTALILVGLFAFQHRGTAVIAILFGPIMAVWFVVIAIAGARQVAADPGVLAAFNPLLAFHFFVSHGAIALITLGAVFLAVTGAEALYADLGHFGRNPIRAAWIGLALPALVLNYLGQGALVLADPATIKNPFFLLFPRWGLIPMVILATAATVIASQAVISGAYSITRQAIHLGLLPRLEVRHTSEEHAGQIYMPQINWMLLIVVLLLVGWFGSSNALASAYGIAVNGTMVMTCLLAFIVVHKVWGWSLPATAALIGPFLLIDMGFFAANMLKVAHGGWVPLAMGGVIVVVMYSWRRGNSGVVKESGALKAS